MGQRPVRVLHIASGDLWAGAEVMLCALMQAQQQLPGVQPYAMLLNEGELARRLRAASIPTFVLPEAQLGFWRLCREGRALVRSVQPDVVHTHRVKEDVLGAMATLGNRRLRRVRTVHGLDEALNAPGNVKRDLARRLHRLCVGRMFHLTCAVSGTLAETLGHQYGAGSVCYVPNGLDPQSLQHPVRRAGTPQAPCVIGFVGRLVPVKRVDLFLEMAACVESSAPGRFEFRIIGEGPQREVLQALARRLNVSHAVRFLGFTSEVATEIAALSLLYLTSDSEGLPMVLLEAMALGVPVVAPAVGEIPRVLDGGRCGTLIERQLAQTYAEPALAYLVQPGEFHARALAAVERVRSHYSALQCAQSYVEHYRRLLGAASS